MKTANYIMKFVGRRFILPLALIFGFLKSLAINNAHAISGITLGGGASDINSKVLCPIASAMFWILMSVSVIMILYGGFLYVTSYANPERVSKAHKTILYAAVGIVVALVAGALPTIVGNLFEVSGVSVCGGGGGGGGIGAGSCSQGTCQTACDATSQIEVGSCSTGVCCVAGGG